MTYAGDVSPKDAYDALMADPTAVLVDVRTRAEWTYVGVPVLPDLTKDVHFIEWQTYPHGEVNTAFVEEMREQGIAQGQAVYFICRSGVRSAFAASAYTATGGGPAYNVSEGFEGDHDGEQHRGIAAGWKAAGLPWRQG